MLIARWCGVPFKQLYQKMRNKLSDRREEIEDIIDGSGWYNAELFANTFLRSLKEISQDGEALENSVQDTFGDFDELERAREYRALRERIMTIQEERHRIYSRGFEAGRQSERTRNRSDKLFKHCNCIIDMAISLLAWIEGYINNEDYYTEGLQNVIKSFYPLLEGFRPDVDA